VNGLYIAVPFSAALMFLAFFVLQGSLRLASRRGARRRGLAFHTPAIPLGWPTRFARARMDQHLLYTMAAVLVLGVGAQWLSWRLKLPSILSAADPGHPRRARHRPPRAGRMFGDMLFPMVSLGVALVLFEGGMTLRFAICADTGAR
jgi:hypothetical protein